jgi:chromosome segregation ATPase
MKFFRHFLWVVVLAFPLQSFAQKWQLRQEKSDPYLGVPSCRALTVLSAPEGFVQLSLSFPKDRLQAPVAMISLDQASSGERVEIHLSKDQKSQWALPLEKASSRGESYWYIPLDMDQLMAEISKAYSLNIDIEKDGQKKSVALSLDGSSYTLMMVKKCLKDDAIYDHDFFRDLKDENVAALPVNGQASVERLQELFQMSYSFFKERKELEKSLQSLKEKNKDALSKEAQAQKDLEQLNGDIQAATVALQQEQTRVQEARQDLATAQKESERLEDARQQAQAEFTRQKTELSPLTQKDESLKNQITAEENRQALFKTEISQAQEKSAQAEATLQKLTAEKKSLQDEISRTSPQNEAFKKQRADLEARIQALDMNKEIAARMEKEQSFHASVGAIESFRKVLVERQEQAHTTQVARQEAQVQFEKCRQAHLSQETIACDGEISRLREAQTQNTAQMGLLREVNEKIFGEQNKIQTLRDGIAKQVLKERDDLQFQYDVVQAQVTDLSGLIDRDQTRASQIEGTEMPGVQKEMAQAAALIKDRQDKTVASVNLQNSLQKEVGDFLAATDFTRLNAELTSAQNRLKSVEDRIAQRKERTQQAQILLQDSVTTLPKLQKNLEEGTMKLPATTDALQRIETGLAEYHKQVDAFTQRLTEVTAQYSQTLGYYKSVLNQLFEKERTLEVANQ